MDGRQAAREDGLASGGTSAPRRGGAADHPLAHVRRRHGWSYQDLAKVIADQARALGVPMAARREKVWRWEHWGVVPEADSQRALARALGVPARELELRPWPRWLPAHGGMPDSLPWTARGAGAALAFLVDGAAADGSDATDGGDGAEGVEKAEGADGTGRGDRAEEAEGFGGAEGSAGAGTAAGAAAVGVRAPGVRPAGSATVAAAVGPAGRPVGGMRGMASVGARGVAAAGARGVAAAEGRALREAIADWDAATAEERGAAAGAATAETGPDAGFADADPVPGGGPSDPSDAAPAPGTLAAVEAVADASVVTWLESGVLGLRRLDDRLGGAAVRHRVEADLRLVRGLLDSGAHRRPERARLLAVAADLAQLGGWAATDTGRYGAAQRHFLTGLRLAHSAGDRAAAVSLWGGLSLQAVLAGHPGDALAAAEAAVRAAGGAPAAVRALAASRLARAHAAAGAEGAFRRAAAEAERQLAASHGDPGPAWLYWLDGAELAAQAGQSLLDLGLPYEARPLLEQALAVQEPAFVRDRALYSVRAAEARVLTGDHDGARALHREGAALARLAPSPRLTAALTRLASCL